MERRNQIIPILLKINHFRIKSEYQKAITLLLRTYEKIEKSYELCELLSDLFFSLAASSPNETGENYKKAIYWLKIAIDNNVRNSRLHSKLGDLYWLGVLDYDSSTEEYKKAIELDSNNLKAYKGIISLYESPDSSISTDEVLLCLRRACELEPDNPINYAQLGNFLFVNGNKDEAMNLWFQALSCTKPLEEWYVNYINEQL